MQSWSTKKQRFNLLGHTADIFVQSYVYRSAKFDAKFFNFPLAYLFSFTFGRKVSYIGER